jgi:predicted DNA-binding protein (MmcQ/YjbR family)
MPPYMAHHGWLGLRLDVGDVDWDEVEALVLQSYRLIAPKRLASPLDT